VHGTFWVHGGVRWHHQSLGHVTNIMAYLPMVGAAVVAMLTMLSYNHHGVLSSTTRSDTLTRSPYSRHYFIVNAMYGNNSASVYCCGHKDLVNSLSVCLCPLQYLLLLLCYGLRVSRNQFLSSFLRGSPGKKLFEYFLIVLCRVVNRTLRCYCHRLPVI
jgi:hypothetical protein